MNRQTAYNIIATLIVILALALLSTLTGCASTSMSRAPDGTLTWESTTLWKDIEAVSAEADGVRFDLGSSASSEGATNPALVACLIAPQLDGCPK